MNEPSENLKKSISLDERLWRIAQSEDAITVDCTKMTLHPFDFFVTHCFNRKSKFSGLWA